MKPEDCLPDMLRVLAYCRTQGRTAGVSCCKCYVTHRCSSTMTCRGSGHHLRTNVPVGWCHSSPWNCLGSGSYLSSLRSLLLYVYVRRGVGEAACCVSKSRLGRARYNLHDLLVIGKHDQYHAVFYIGWGTVIKIVKPTNFWRFKKNSWWIGTNQRKIGLYRSLSWK